MLAVGLLWITFLLLAGLIALQERDLRAADYYKDICKHEYGTFPRFKVLTGPIKGRHICFGMAFLLVVVHVGLMFTGCACTVAGVPWR